MVAYDRSDVAVATGRPASGRSRRAQASPS